MTNTTKDSTYPHTMKDKHSLEEGLDVKYLSMDRCRDGILQQQNTNALAAMMPVRWREADRERCVISTSKYSSCIEF